MIGLKLRIGVDHDGTYVKNNRTFDSWRVKRMSPRSDVPARGPDHVAIAAQSKQSSGGSSSSSSRSAPAGKRDMDDDIPF